MSVATAVAKTRSQDVRAPRRSDEWAGAVFGTWMITGLFLDGWAHAANKPETFFSPWHGVLYSGFAAGMVYAAIDSYRMRRRGEAVAMEPYMLADLIVFGAAGVGDMIWHQIFGIEVALEALVSPSHLLLMIGGSLLATFGLRTAWRDPDDESRTRTFGAFLPTIISVAEAFALISFFTMYASPFSLERLTGGSSDRFEGEAMHALAAFLFANVLFVAALLVVLRRWTPPTGTFTLLFGVVASAMTGLNGFERVELAIAAVAGGVAADLLTRRLRPSPDSPRTVRTIAAGFPVVLWLSYFVVAGASGTLGWSVELWSGVLVLTSLSGFGLSLLVLPPPVPVRTTL